MKIKKVEFRNINSLAGTWVIDFEDEQFKNSSMFCISGPTGSGKTSILDAICLALYGETPRQETINKSSNEVMTYGTKDCYAKVSFECKGVDYTAEWKQHRAERTGKLQGYEWLLTDLSTLAVISYSNQKEIEKKMTDIVGLDFDQFTKSMMLAQGEFNKFLKCNETLRAAILEKLTGDTVYRKIAVAVYNLYKQANEAVKDLEKQLDGIATLNDEDRQKLEQNLAASAERKIALDAEIKRLEVICTWYAKLHDLEKAKVKAGEQMVAAETAHRNFEPSEKKLEAALRAQEIESSYTEYKTLQGNMERTLAQLAEANGKVPTSQQELESAKKIAVEKKAALDKLNIVYAENEKIWEKVSTLDADIASKQKNVRSSVANVVKIRGEIASLQGSMRSVESNLETDRKNLQAVLDYIESNSVDEGIEPRFTHLKSCVVDWKRAAGNVVAGGDALKVAQAAVAEFDAKQQQQKDSLRTLQEYLTAHQVDDNLVNVLPEMERLAKDLVERYDDTVHLQSEIARHKQLAEKFGGDCRMAENEIAGLNWEKEGIIQQDIPIVVAELRKKLRKGDACPVCGSREHPSSDGIPENAAAASIEGGVDCLNDFAEKLRKINADIEKKQSVLNATAGKKQAEEEALSELSQKLEKATAAEKTASVQLNEKLKPWNKTADLKTVGMILSDLATARDAFLQKKKEADGLQVQVNSAQVDRAKLQNAAENAKSDLQKATEASATLEGEVREQFAPWFKDVTLVGAESLLAQLVEKSGIWKEKQTQKATLEKNVSGGEINLKAILKNLDDAGVRLAEAQDAAAKQQGELDASSNQRKALFGEKNVETERQNARNQRAAAERDSNAAAENAQNKQNALNALENSIKGYKSTLEEISPNFEAAQRTLTEKLGEKNFADEAQFLATRLPEGERRMLQTQKENIDRDLTAARTSVKTSGEQFEAHLAVRDFQDAEEVATAQKATRKGELDALNTNVGEWTQQKKNDDEQRQKVADKQAKLERKKAKRSSWEQMQRWFAGARLTDGTGNAFVKFIQVITLKNLLRHANGYLRDMFPRYEMVAAKVAGEGGVLEDSLDIQLIDHDNSDSVRPVSNISGGEGFLVSLSLALGISALASQNVRIDSMFLDEGFGTLDSKMLQETIIVLQKMQKEKGKQLGVITHVDLVKQELSTHIEVSPRGGRSVLSGAGVRQVANR